MYFPCKGLWTIGYLLEVGYQKYLKKIPHPSNFHEMLVVVLL